MDCKRKHNEILLYLSRITQVDYAKCWQGYGTLQFCHTGENNVKWYNQEQSFITVNASTIRLNYSTPSICPREMNMSMPRLVN